MKRLIAAGLTVIMALPALADEKAKTSPVVPDHTGTEKIESIVQNFKNEKYLSKSGLDASTFLKVQQYFAPHTNDTVRDRQYIAGSTLLAGSAAAGITSARWKRAKALAEQKLAAASAPKVAPKATVGTNGQVGNNGKVPNLSAPKAPKATATTTTPKVKVKGTVGSRLMKGAAILLAAAGTYEIYNGYMSNTMIKARNEEIRNRAKSFIGTPLEEAMRFQLGQDATDEIIASMMTPAEGDGADPMVVMAVKWSKPRDLEQLADWSEEAKKEFMAMMSDAGGELFIKDADVRESLADFYGDRIAILRLRLRDSQASDQVAYDEKFKQAMKRYKAEIKKEIASWDEKTASDIVSEEDMIPHADAVETGPEVHNK